MSKEEKTGVVVVTLEAERDDSSIGDRVREHWVFPKVPKKGYDRATIPDIGGGIYLKKGTETPHRIVIILRKEEKE